MTTNRLQERTVFKDSIQNISTKDLKSLVENFSIKTTNTNERLEELLRSNCVTSNNSPEPHLELAEFLFKKGAFSESLNCLQQAFSLADKDQRIIQNQIYAKLGLVHFQLGNIDKAKEYALKINCSTINDLKYLRF